VNPRPLSAPRLLGVAAFALTCFCLMLYLWNAFGGAVPFKPNGYRVTVALPEADLLAVEADVRISGVTIGRVVAGGPRAPPPPPPPPPPRSSRSIPPRCRCAATCAP
jgi:ABC-type transporter Mla subunit MlaD